MCIYASWQEQSGFERSVAAICSISFLSLHHFLRLCSYVEAVAAAGCTGSPARRSNVSQMWDQELPSEDNMHQHKLSLLLDEAGSEYQLVGKRAHTESGPIVGVPGRILEPTILELDIVEKQWLR